MISHIVALIDKVRMCNQVIVYCIKSGLHLRITNDAVNSILIFALLYFFLLSRKVKLLPIPARHKCRPEEQNCHKKCRFSCLHVTIF